MPSLSTKVGIIGSGFSGLASAAILAKAGLDITVFEKNTSLGGRAREFEANGFRFDMGPSWYWMPDIFENFFAIFNKKPQDYYELLRLDPSYKIFFGESSSTNDKANETKAKKFDFKETFSVPATIEKTYELFDKLEPGSATKLHKFIEDSAYKYQIGMHDLVYKPSLNLFEFMQVNVLKGLFECDLFRSIKSYVRENFKNPQLIELLEFPVLFLGATAAKTPSLYSLMNYADLKLGTWYPQGGMHQIIKAIKQICLEHGVKIQTSCEIKNINTLNGEVISVSTAQQTKDGALISEVQDLDYLICSADYHHVDRELLHPQDANYSEEYWDKRTMSPSSLIFYLGIDSKLDNLEHHNLFFDESLEQHAHEIYTKPQWPSRPLFYVSCPSKTDSSCAPAGKENLFVLIPLAPDLEDNEETRERYYDLIMQRLEKLTKQKITDKVIYKRSFAHNDFSKDYNSYKGNAYGLANTLAQTAILKPSLRSKNLKNMYFAGQLSVPGPGMPPSLISGQLAASELMKDLEKSLKKELVF